MYFEHAALGEQATDLRLRADRIATLWRLAKRDFEQATSQYDTAVDTGRRASEHFASAVEDFQRAEERYRHTALLIIAVAASAQLCASTVSTRSFRAQLRAEGLDLTGQDIDHVWPRSLGGIDHPLNYQVLDAHLNRSLGAGIVQKFMTQPWRSCRAWPSRRSPPSPADVRRPLDAHCPIMDGLPMASKVDISINDLAEMTRSGQRRLSEMQRCPVWRATQDDAVRAEEVLPVATPPTVLFCTPGMKGENNHG